MRSIGARLVAPSSEAVGFWCSLIFSSSLLIFLWHIDAWPQPHFDETWYVPTARELIATGEMLHQEHPPLGKLLISFGVTIFGDGPFGWRAMSAVFGSITLLGMFLWSYALLRAIAPALWVAAITLFSQFLYVQSRIATLDIFVMAFCALGLAFFTFSLQERGSGRRCFAYAILAGASLGLGGACKWSGFFLLAGLIAVACLIQLFRLWQVRFADARPADFYGDDVWAAMTPLKTIVALGVVPFLAYFASYVPQMIHAGSMWEFVNSHRRMFEILSGNAGTHPYSSGWYAWPRLTRPVWYLFEARDRGTPWSAQNPASAILALPNPLILCAGEIAIVATTLAWLRARNMNAMIVTVGFWSQYLPWAIDPKGLEFSYYYFPPLLCIGPALALILFRRERPWLTYPV